MKFGFIAKHRSVWPVAWLCKALGVSRSGFHAWLKRGPGARSREDDAIMPAVRASFVASARTYGARRVWRDVLEAGFSCGLHKIERLMRAQALRARPRRRTQPKDDGERSASAIALNVLDRQFTADQPNRKWIADFTYVWTAEGWLNVAAVIDPSSRRVVGWSMKAEMSAARHRRVANGDLAARAPGCAVASLRPGQPIHERAVPAAHGRQRCRLFDEPLRKRMGQRRHGKLLFVAENRADRPKGLPYAGRRQGRRVRLRRVRLHRKILQHDPQELDQRLPQPGQARKEGWISLTAPPRNRQQATPSPLSEGRRGPHGLLMSMTHEVLARGGRYVGCSRPRCSSPTVPASRSASAGNPGQNLSFTTDLLQLTSLRIVRLTVTASDCDRNRQVDTAR